jgi:hypothetical protein
MLSARSIARRIFTRGPITAESVQMAAEEVKNKSIKEIEGETALAWGARALAAWRAAEELRQSGHEDTAKRLEAEALAYKGEAIEHAAFAKEGVLEAVRGQLEEIPY